MLERLGPGSRRVGFFGLGVLFVAFVLTSVALAMGVHCPQCDQHHLTAAEYDFWEKYFFAKNGVYLAATVLLAAAIPFATPRRLPFVLGFLVAVFAFAVTPK